jgi:hypothetical protein
MCRNLPHVRLHGGFGSQDKTFAVDQVGSTRARVWRARSEHHDVAPSHL